MNLHPSAVPLFMIVLFSVSCAPPGSDPSGSLMKSAEIPFTNLPVIIDGELDDAAWQSATTVGPFEFPWWEQGKKEETRAQLLWDQDYLYVGFTCEDAHIWAEHTERDSPVYKDDCVEVFTSPNPDQLNVYFNVEMNVTGITLDYMHPEGPGTKEPWDPEIKIASVIDGTLNDDSDIDNRWTLEVAIPFTAFEEVAKNTPPQPGDVWRLNLHRLGGKTNFQYSQWSPAVSEKVLFHAPQFFGRVTFVK